MESNVEKLVNLKKDDDEVVRIKDATTRGGEYTEAYSIGYDIFDDAMRGGVRAGDLVIITGISGNGKTTYAQNISVNLSKNALPSLWFSYEVVVDNLYAKFKEMGVNEEELLIYVPKRNTSGNIEWIKKKICEGREKMSTKFIFIDHIDFLTPSKLSGVDQRRIILRDICQELKTLAIELEVVIFLVAHVKKVQGREVEMQDIAESSGIFQIADYIFSISRIFNIQKMESRKIQMASSKSMVKILKNRPFGEEPVLQCFFDNNIIKPMEDELVDTVKSFSND